MCVIFAVSSAPTRALPTILGAPVGASFTSSTYSSNQYFWLLSSWPSLTLNSNLV